MVFLIIYLFYALTSLFVMPRYTPLTAKAAIFSGTGLRRQSAQSNGSSFNFIAMTDRSVVDNDKMNSIKSVAAIFLIIFTVLGLFRVKIISAVPHPANACNLRFCYLSYCTLKI